MGANNSHAFHRLALLTVVAVYLLIMVGGVVRATGSGMGCPDWPKCFGRWVPPTDVAQLPSDYRTRYATENHGVEEFNAAKTWTEYVNRLIGVVIGLLIFATMIAARRFLRTDPPVFWWSVAAFILVGFQGWLGSVVVASNLAVWLVTVHMLVALVIVFMLLYVVVRARREETVSGARSWQQLDTWFGAVLGLTLVQVGMGTQVRERIDELDAAGLIPRAQWIAESGTLTVVHRSFSILLILVTLLLLRRLVRDCRLAGSEVALAKAIVVVLLAEVLAGIALFYLALPPWLQPVHLLLASVLAGLLFALWLRWRDTRVSVATASPSVATR